MTILAAALTVLPCSMSRAVSFINPELLLRIGSRDAGIHGWEPFFCYRCIFGRMKDLSGEAKWTSPR
jgi:hypothetical protein